ncbi:MAG: hypothetical protein KDE59_18510 [Anaerolineales bacterium]|nr:hypothetical protein [Anaerolineales bacterium]MCB0006007.1 hypothetical protein [Anaerolineales bacterium]MCB0011895.1 hypothetical protein [Anaerolineales bacterium]MCB8962246.1 hypothetical protein [Ardenticatenales bacterium]
MSEKQNSQDKAAKPAGPAPQASPEWAAELPAPAAAFARLSGSGPVNPDDILNMQRTVGNQAVQRFLDSRTETRVQRDPDPVEHIDASMFTVSGGDLQHDGVVTAGPADDLVQVSINAPRITFSATVDKHDDAVLGAGNFVSVGPVQTLNSSQRVGIYRLGGDPNGPIVTRHNQAVGQVRDAQWNTNDDGEIYATAPEPFYSQPSLISDGSPSATVNYLDQPGFELAPSIGQGILTEVEGAESFTLSVAVKKGEELVHLKNHNWSVDWNVPITPLGRTEGSAIQSSATTDNPAVTSGNIAVQMVRSWLGFPTVEAAMGVSSHTLMSNLIPARQNDTTSYNNIVEALRRKNPAIKIWLTVEETAETFGADEIEVTLTGSSSATEGPVTLNDNEWDTFDFHLLDVLDPGDISEDSSITISAADTGMISNDAATIPWNYPFAESRRSYTMSGGGGGRYSVMAELI